VLDKNATGRLDYDTFSSLLDDGILKPAVGDLSTDYFNKSAHPGL
jgi:hypothetical protein